MRLEYYSLEKLKREILGILSRHLDLTTCQVFFFGSRVTKKGTDRSDIDVGIEGKTPIPFGTMDRIVEEIEEIPTLYKIEIVDFKRIPEKFREVAVPTREFITTP